MILVIGDSWSHDRPNLSIEAENFYPVSSSLKSRLETFEQPVLNMSHPGADDCNAIGVLLDATNGTTEDTLKQKHLVIWGWTDWTRSLPQTPTQHYYKTQPKSITNCYYKDRQEIASVIKDKIELANKKLPNTKILHWGGHGSVMREAVPNNDQNIILYEDYAKERVGCPKNSYGLLSHSIILNPFDIWNVINEDLGSEILEQCARIVEFKNQNNKFFPDRMHLSFKYYDQLITRIEEFI